VTQCINLIQNLLWPRMAGQSESCGFTACLSHVLPIHGHYNLVQHIKFHAEWDLISSKSYISTRSMIFIHHTAGSYLVFHAHAADYVQTILL
jgi:hypothetical protein